MPDDKQEPRTALKILTTVRSNAEAAIIVGDLEASGIQAMQRPGALPGGLWGATGSRDVYVEERDFERAREILDAEPMSEDELVRAEEDDAAGRPPSPSE
jgi:hypothetical protein